MVVAEQFDLIKVKPKIRLERNAEHQRYYLKNGKQVSGASTISKMGDSYEGIVYWAWKLGTQGKDYKKERDSFADTGTIVHFLVNCYLLGAEPDLREFTDEEIDLAMPGFEKFLDFWGKEGLTALAVEEQLVHNKLKYGGTLDLRAVDEYGKFVLCDWKSSKKLYNSHVWQLGGYELLSNYNHPDQIIDRRAIIRTGRDKNDVFHAHWIPQHKAERNMEIFKHQVKLYNVLNEKRS